MDTEKKKKIVVLVMSCQDPFFKKEEMVCRDTWAKPILKGQYDNIEYYSYVGGCERSYVDFHDHRIYCKSGDGIFETYQKTYEVFKLLDRFDIEYDYIFRTNTSTVVNVGLLDAFINSGLNDECVYCGELYTIGLPCPLTNSIYARGNSVILSRHLIDVIMDFDKHVVVPPTLFADDNIIGNTINVYHFLQFADYRDFLKSYGFAWYECYPKEHIMSQLNNGLSSWGNTDSSYEYLKNFISIQIKSYVDRETEFKKMKKLSDIVSRKKDDYTEELEFINKYMANPKVYVYNRKRNSHGYLNLYAEQKQEKENTTGQSKVD